MITPFCPARCLSAVAVALVLATSVGCSGDKLHPVRGKVVFPDGQPLTGGWVTFQSVGAEKVISADGELNPDGTFEVRTHKPGDGVPPGRYQVTVRGPLLGEGVPPVIERKYSDFATSGLEFTVEPQENDFTITVTPYKKP